MTTQNQSEKDRRSATSSAADADAEAPVEIVQELTEEELRTVSGGTHQVQASNLDSQYFKQADDGSMVRR